MRKRLSTEEKNARTFKKYIKGLSRSLEGMSVGNVDCYWLVINGILSGPQTEQKQQFFEQLFARRIPLTLKEIQERKRNKTPLDVLESGYPL